jgi:haloalkane dehalogenase
MPFNSALYPFVSHYLDRGGLRLHYLDEGGGEPLVMLHGNPTWSFYFRNLVLAQRPEYRCIVPDHIGCGLSDKPGADRYDFSLKSRVDDLEALLDHLRLRDHLTLVLHDWGGMIGMAYAARHPERIRRLIVSNTAAFHLPQGKSLPLTLWLGRNTGFGAWCILHLNAFCRAAARWCVHRRPLPPEVREAYLAPHDKPAHRLAVLRFLQSVPLRPGDLGFNIVSDVEKSLGRLRDCPLLLCWGMKDFVFDRDYLAEWQRHFPQAEVVRIEDAGHYVLEDAAEEVIENVRRFLSAQPLTKPPSQA